MILSITLICTFATEASAQRSAVIDSGTTIHVRTIDDINTKDADGQVFPGVVDADVMGRNGRIVIPRGSDVELVVRTVPDNNDVALDLDSIMVNGERYSVEADPTVLESERREGLGTNKRTGKYVGGGAVLGAIIGGIAGGGKGAAIGAGAGAAAGTGVAAATGKEEAVIPAEKSITFTTTAATTAK